MNAKEFLNYAANEGYQWDVNGLVALAGTRRLHFTADQLATAADELWGNLSEEELRSTVGGKNNTTSNTTPPGQLDPGTPWSPPPGDVSGRSCFFMRAG